jgi:hypothetical protein
VTNKAALQKYGSRLVNALQIYLRSLNTHGANNDVVTRARDELHEILIEHFSVEPQSAIQVQLLPEETFINNTLLPIAIGDFERVKDLTKQLHSVGVGELIFDSSVTLEALSGLAVAVYEGMHARRHLEPRVFTGIEALQMEYAVSGSSERDAHQVVVWLFSGLLDGLDGLQDLVSEGHTPTMVPFMRHMRLLVDLNRESSTVIRHLCFARQGEDGGGEIHRAACRTFLAIQVGHQNGLERAELLALGLASVLDVVTQGTEPERIVPALAPYTSLSDLAPQVMMTLRDFEMARRGEHAGPKGQLLLALDVIVNTVHGEEIATLDEVFAALGALSALEPEVLQAIDAWLGELPIGAVAHSHGLGEVLLFDWGKDGSTMRCRPVVSGSLGEAQMVEDLDASQPISFSSRMDFEYELPEEDPPVSEDRPLSVDEG